MNDILYNSKPFEISFLVQCMVYSIPKQFRTSTGKPINAARIFFSSLLNFKESIASYSHISCKYMNLKIEKLYIFLV